MQAKTARLQLRQHDEQVACAATVRLVQFQEQLGGVWAGIAACRCGPSQEIAVCLVAAAAWGATCLVVCAAMPVEGAAQKIRQIAQVPVGMCRLSLASR